MRKAVIPAAGLGTRFLPATKAVPKEMLPVVDKPALQYVVEEAAAAGLDDVVVITGWGKRALEDHFDRARDLESALEAKGDHEKAALVRAPAELATLHFVRQGEPLGLGHAVLCAEQHVGQEAFAVLLGDDIIGPHDSLLAQMCALHERTGGSVLGLIEVPPEQASLYGCPAVEAPSAELADNPDVVRITRLVEKPSPEEAPSAYAVIGRYVLTPAVFGLLHETQPGRGGEIQLTDAIDALCRQEPVHGLVFRGRRYDTGDRGSYLRAVVELAADRADLGPAFMAWLREFVAANPEAPSA